METPHLNLVLDEKFIVDGAAQILSFLRPNWNLTDIKYKTFTEGITNKLIGCFNSKYENDVILIRVYGNNTDLLIDRQAEIKNIKILNTFGLAPNLYATFNNGIVYEYVPGEVLTSSTCRLGHISSLVAKNMAKIHSVNASCFIKQPSLFITIKKFLDLVPKKFSSEKNEKRYDELHKVKPNLEEEFIFLQNELKSLPSPVVFCHNDLLLKNIIYNSNNNSVTFIDYEYASYNYQAYDIANHFNEYAGVAEVNYELFPDEEYQKNWIYTYLKEFKKNMEGCTNPEVTTEDVNSLYVQVQKYTLASHFLWGLWCFLQAEYSSIDFDFLKYSLVRFSEYYNRKKKIFSC